MRALLLGITTALFVIEGAPCQSASLSPNTIVASGNAEILASPDSASIDIGVITSNPVTAAALHANDVEMARVVAAIRALGISNTNMQTSNFAIEAQHPQSKNGEADESRISGYTVTNKLTVSVSDLTKVAAIIDEAVKAGANSSNSVSFDLKDRAAIDDKALADAVRNARHRAEIMASAENAKVGRMISVTNDISYGEIREGLAAPEAIMVVNDKTPVLPGQISVEAQVVVVFSTE
jgi:uncharacterized protein